VTIVSMSYMTVEALHAVNFLRQCGVSAELVDLRSIRPLDWDTVLSSVRKTGRLVAVDTSHEMCSVASEIVATAAAECFAHLKAAPRRLTLPDHPSPTSPALAERFYPRAEDIAASVGDLVGRRFDVGPLVAARSAPHDVPGDWFKGPF
jgi:pyruvate dehydrogenase E1 component beta subunit